MKKLQYIVLCGLLLLAVACEKDTLPMNFSPALTTGTASDIFRVGATLSGTIQKSDGVVVKDCGILISELQSMAEYTEIKTPSAENTFEVLAQNLEPGKKYYYCAYASSGYSIARGEIKEFTTTDSNAPVFSELAVENKDEKSFTVASTILDEGGSDLILCGFCWKLAEEDSNEPTVEDKVSNVSAQSSAISTRIKDLTPNKNYLVRAYGINAKGVGYGKTVAVSTNNATVPAVSSITPVDSTALSVSVKAAILSAGESTVTEIGFCWSAENQEPTTANMKYDATGQGQAGFTYSIEGLTPETTYYIRGYAVNGQGTGYGDVYKFTTKKETEPGIYSLQDLIDFRDAKNVDADLSKWKNANGVIKLFADIDMKSVSEWNPIHTIRDDEVLDGNTHTISNIKMIVTDSHEGGFIYVNGGSVRNLTIAGTMVAQPASQGRLDAGGICIMNYGQIYNCHSYVKADLTGRDTDYGGISRFCLDGGSIENCSNHGDVKATCISGISAVIGKSKIINCHNYAVLENIACQDKSNNNEAIGGIAYYSRDASITGCSNQGKVITNLDSDSYGGICALPDSATVITNCSNKGEVIGSSSFAAGGIVGSVQFGHVTITGCENTGSVTAPGYGSVGGICGLIGGFGRGVADLNISENTNRGTVTSTSDGYAGGICGYVHPDAVWTNNNTNGGIVNGVAGTEANAIGEDGRTAGTGTRLSFAFPRVNSIYYKWK